MPERSGAPEIFVRVAPEFRIDEDGIGHVRVVSGESEFSFRCTPHVLLAASSAAMRAYVEWDAERAEVASLVRPRFDGEAG